MIPESHRVSFEYIQFLHFTKCLNLGDTEKVHTGTLSDEELFTLLRTKIDENFPSATEPKFKLRRRAEVTKKIIAKHVSTLNISDAEDEESLSEQDSFPKTIILGHNRILCEYKGRDINPDIEARDEVKFPHCQFVPDYTDYSKVDF